MEALQMGVVQMGVVQLGVVQLGVVQMGLVQMTPQSKWGKFNYGYQTICKKYGQVGLGYPWKEQ